MRVSLAARRRAKRRGRKQKSGRGEAWFDLTGCGVSSSTAASSSSSVARGQRARRAIYAQACDATMWPVWGSVADRRAALAQELLFQHALFEIVLGIEEHGERNIGTLAHLDRGDVAHFGKVGGRADRPLLSLQNIESDPRRMRQQRAAPTPWPEGADRRQRQDIRGEGNDRSMRREVIGGAADRRGNDDTIGHQLVELHE